MTLVSINPALGERPLFDGDAVIYIIRVHQLWSLHDRDHVSISVMINAIACHTSTQEFGVISPLPVFR